MQTGKILVKIYILLVLIVVSIIPYASHGRNITFSLNPIELNSVLYRLYRRIYY